MPSYVILQEDTPAENASLTGKGRQAPLKAASRPVQGDVSDHAFHGFRLVPWRMLR